MYQSGLKKRATPTTELVGVALSAAIALTVQLQTAAATIRAAAPTAAHGSRPTLIIK